MAFTETKDVLKCEMVWKETNISTHLVRLFSSDRFCPPEKLQRMMVAWACSCWGGSGFCDLQWDQRGFVFKEGKMHLTSICICYCEGKKRVILIGLSFGLPVSHSALVFFFFFFPGYQLNGIMFECSGSICCWTSACDTLKSTFQCQLASILHTRLGAGISSNITFGYFSAWIFMKVILILIRDEPTAGCVFTFRSVVQRMLQLEQSQKAFISPAVGVQMLLVICIQPAVCEI